MAVLAVAGGLVWAADRLAWSAGGPEAQCLVLEDDWCRALPPERVLAMVSRSAVLPADVEVLRSGSRPGFMVKVGSEFALLRSEHQMDLPPGCGSPAELSEGWHDRLSEEGFVEVTYRRSVTWQDGFVGTVVGGQDVEGRTLLYITRGAQ
ncbi:MAG TPA: hypothetical protein VIL55_01080 [Naasia sp.]